MSQRLAGWYQVEWADEVAAGLGPTFEDGHAAGVVVRTLDGAVGAIGRFCRHRSVDLTATASITNSGVRCRFHGWETSTDGSVRPCEELGGGDLELRTVSWAAVETCGGVWIWLGGRTPAWDLVAALDEALPSEYHLAARRTYTVGTGVERIIENTVDPWHLKYLHGSPSVPELRLREEGSSLVFALEFTDRPSVRGAWLGPGLEYLRFGGDLGLVQLVGLFPVGPSNSVYRTQVLAPEGADEVAVADAIAAQFAALDEDIVVWNATGARSRSALAEAEREPQSILETWLNAQRIGPGPGRSEQSA